VFINSLREVSSSQISVVVQGAVDKDSTASCLKSIRKCLPEAEIVLSTWEGSKLEGLDFDILVSNQDPGAVKDPLNGITINLNRQIVSTKNGILKSNKPYILKTRSDLYFSNSSFLDYWNKYEERTDEHVLFEHKILMSSFYCKKYIGFETKMPVPFHLGDWTFFGTRDDLLVLWDIPLAKEPFFTNYFWMSPYKGIKFDGFKASHQFAPEQYILLEAMKKRGYKDVMKDYLDYNHYNIDLSNKIIINNFVLLDPKQWSYHSLKNQYSQWTNDLETLPAELKYGLYLNSLYERELAKFTKSKNENLNG